MTKEDMIDTIKVVMSYLYKDVGDTWYGDLLDDVLEELKNSAVEPIRYGHWVVDEDGNIECSECGHHGVGDNYCERCGARMEEEKR